MTVIGSHQIIYFTWRLTTLQYCGCFCLETHKKYATQNGLTRAKTEKGERISKLDWGEPLSSQLAEMGSSKSTHRKSISQLVEITGLSWGFKPKENLSTWKTSSCHPGLQESCGVWEAKGPTAGSDLLFLSQVMKTQNQSSAEGHFVANQEEHEMHI